MKKIGKMALCITLMVLMMTGCGEAKIPDTMDNSIISVAKTGEVTEYLVDEFFEKYFYDLSGLKSMAVEEAALYNTEHQVGDTVPVKVESVEIMEEGSNRVRIVYRYDSAESYTGFNRESSLFYGTVGEAISKGYSTKVVLTSVKDSTSFTEEQLKQATDKYLIISTGGVYVYCPGTVEYISENASIAEDGSVDATETTVKDKVYILLK